MASVGPEVIFGTIREYFPDPRVRDERVRRISTLTPFLRTIGREVGWDIQRLSGGLFELQRERTLRRGGQLFQHLVIDVPNGAMRRYDRFEVTAPLFMPPEVSLRRNGGAHRPEFLELMTAITGAPGKEASVTERKQRVIWAYGDQLQRYGGSVRLRDVHQDYIEHQLPEARLDIAVTGAPRFTPQWLIHDVMRLDDKRPGLFNAPLEPDRTLPLDLLDRFDEIFELNPLRQSMDVFANLVRGLVHKSMNAPDIPEHPALRAF